MLGIHIYASVSRFPVELEMCIYTNLQ